MTNDARVILAVAAEADVNFVWDKLKVIQADMFAAGPVSIKFTYFGAEGALALNEALHFGGDQGFGVLGYAASLGEMR